jgi:hypothetical protein
MWLFVCSFWRTNSHQIDLCFDALRILVDYPLFVLHKRCVVENGKDEFFLKSNWLHFDREFEMQCQAFWLLTRVEILNSI